MSLLAVSGNRIRHVPDLFDCAVEASFLAGLRLSRMAIARGELVVIPTDTVYGLAADAFSPAAVARLLAAKGRDRQSPPPVLIAELATLAALTDSVSPEVQALTEAFWPGGLTVIVRARPSLAWDLGETRGTVAVRIPADRVARALLQETGPLAVSSANLTGLPAATTAHAAREMLGDRVSVYLDGGTVGSGYAAIGERPGDTSSTIVDASGLDRGEPLKIVRRGVISRDQLIAVVDENHFEAP